MKIIKISAMWCPSCLIMNDIVNDVVEANNIELIKYDFDMDADIVNKYNVGNILPVIIKIDDDENEISRIIGEHSKKEIEEFIKE